MDKSGNLKEQSGENCPAVDCGGSNSNVKPDSDDAVVSADIKQRCVNSAEQEKERKKTQKKKEKAGTRMVELGHDDFDIVVFPQCAVQLSD